MICPRIAIGTKSHEINPAPIGDKPTMTNTELSNIPPTMPLTNTLVEMLLFSLEKISVSVVSDTKKDIAEAVTIISESPSKLEVIADKVNATMIKMYVCFLPYFICTKSLSMKVKPIKNVPIGTKKISNLNGGNAAVTTFAITITVRYSKTLIILF